MAIYNITSCQKPNISTPLPKTTKPSFSKIPTLCAHLIPKRIHRKSPFIQCGLESFPNTVSGERLWPRKRTTQGETKFVCVVKQQIAHLFPIPYVSPCLVFEAATLWKSLMLKETLPLLLHMSPHHLMVLKINLKYFRTPGIMLNYFIDHPIYHIYHMYFFVTP